METQQQMADGKYGGMSHAEIAKHLGVSTATVRADEEKALLKLRRAFRLRGYGADDALGREILDELSILRPRG